MVKKTPMMDEEIDMKPPIEDNLNYFKGDFINYQNYNKWSPIHFDKLD